MSIIQTLSSFTLQYRIIEMEQNLFCHSVVFVICHLKGSERDYLKLE